ncbi:hypothetical protein [Viridibacillus arvi]|uniref:hypothetical protein n=1 Tax=Viridibacillus arvi TaxID=263475 RepID=UPI0034CDD882
MNLATLKVFHDAGIDVSSFQNYIVDINYSIDTCEDIFEEGCRALFTYFEKYSMYEEEEEKYIKELLEKNEKKLVVDETIYVCSSNEMKALANHPKYSEKLAQLCGDILKPIFDIDGFSLQSGEIVLCSYSMGEYQEIAVAVVTINQEVNNLYQQLKGEQ